MKYSDENLSKENMPIDWD